MAYAAAVHQGVSTRTGYDFRAKDIDRWHKQRGFTKIEKQFPKAKVVGHCDLDPHKACPCFNVKAEL